jgi:hypothetical protein
VILTVVGQECEPGEQVGKYDAWYQKPIFDIEFSASFDDPHRGLQRWQ